MSIIKNDMMMTEIYLWVSNIEERYHDKLMQKYEIFRQYVNATETNLRLKIIETKEKSSIESNIKHIKNHFKMDS